MRSIRTYPLLQGVRGEPPADIAAAEGSFLRVSQLVTEFPEIVEMDINPLVVHNQGEGAIVLDARIILRGESEHTAEHVEAIHGPSKSPILKIERTKYMATLYVASTETFVGKSAICAALLDHYRAKGHSSAT